MSYRCMNPGQFSGQVVANGSCVRFVQVAARVPHTSTWKEGKKVRGGNIPTGTAIATFVAGRYPNRPSGNHAAILISENADGLLVWDQWKGRPVGKRLIRFRGDDPDLSNNGDAFSVIE
ncbi:MAG: BPSL0067 family protein [Planctomycetota bacterium]